MNREGFEKELQHLINRYSMENGSDTPDFILAEFMRCCLENYEVTVKKRDKWFGIDPWSKILPPAPSPSREKWKAK